MLNSTCYKVAHPPHCQLLLFQCCCETRHRIQNDLALCFSLHEIQPSLLLLGGLWNSMQVSGGYPECNGRHPRGYEVSKICGVNLHMVVLRVPTTGLLFVYDFFGEKTQTSTVFLLFFNTRLIFKVIFFFLFLHSVYIYLTHAITYLYTSILIPI